jgi:adenylate cyclase
MDAFNRTRPAGRSLRIRIGLHSGEVSAGMLDVSGRTDYDVFGDAVNVASRLEALGKELFPGEDAVVLFSGETLGLLEARPAVLTDCGSRLLRDRSARVAVFRLGCA